MQVVSREKSDGSARRSTPLTSSARANFDNIEAFSLCARRRDRGFSAVLAWGRRLLHTHMLKLSPQPHVPLMLGLLKTNSLESFDSTKSISVPRRVSWAFFSINTLTPARQCREQPSQACVYWKLENRDSEGVIRPQIGQRVCNLISATYRLAPLPRQLCLFLWCNPVCKSARYSRASSPRPLNQSWRRQKGQTFQPIFIQWKQDSWTKVCCRLVLRMTDLFFSPPNQHKMQKGGCCLEPTITCLCVDMVIFKQHVEERKLYLVTIQTYKCRDI